MGVIKRVLGFNRVRYRGLAKNAHRLFVTAGLINRHLSRRRSPATRPTDPFTARRDVEHANLHVPPVNAQGSRHHREPGTLITRTPAPRDLLSERARRV